MRILAIAAVLLLSAFPAMAATSSMVEVNADALKTLVMGYLYPSKTAPGDVFSAIQELEREVGPNEAAFISISCWSEMKEQWATCFRGDGGDLVVEPIREGWLRIRIGGVGAEVRKCVALRLAEVIRRTAEGLEDTLG